MGTATGAISGAAAASPIGMGAICGWMQDMPAALFAGTSVKNALKYVEVLAGEEALLRMTLPSFIIGGLGW